jgi:post-segregation antitoxin (ccd killing protein)
MIVRIVVMPRVPKEKLTLSVDEEVVQKAKKLGINISDITEKVLKGYTSAEKPNGGLHDAYRELFDSILPLLKEFGCGVKIAEGVEAAVSTDSKGKEQEDEIPFDVFLVSNGSFYIDTFEYSFSDIKKISPQDFLSAEKILSNLVDALARSKEANEEKMRQIMMAKRIVDAMSETVIKRRLPRAHKTGEKG